MIYYKKIEMLMKVVMNNKIAKGGVPMAAIIFNGNGDIIGQPMTNIIKGHLPKDQADRHQHHAEQLIKKTQKELPKKFMLISLLPPCIQCLNEISKDVEDVKIFYLTDSIRRRCKSNEYNKALNKFKDKVFIDFLEINNKWWNRIKIYYWYMIANLLHSSLNHDGVNKNALRKEIDEFICKIESKIYSENTRKEITFIKNDLDFLKSNREWKK